MVRRENLIKDKGSVVSWKTSGQARMFFSFSPCSRRPVGNPASKPDHLYDEGMKVYVYGNTGIVSGVYRGTGTAKGKPYTRRVRFTGSWVKRNGQWKCVASQSTLIE